MMTVQMPSQKLPLQARRGRLPDLSDAEFGRWRELLETRAGIRLNPQRKPLFLSGLRARMREVGYVDYQAYYEQLSQRDSVRAGVGHPDRSADGARDALFYFDRGERHGLLDRLAGRLTPGGLLVLAPGDVLSWTPPALERIRCEGTLAYQRRVDPEVRD